MNGALPTRSIEKPWGALRLPDPFTAPAGRRIGEIWFEPPAQLPELLVKYLFTSEKLSVQVHPSDDQAQAAGLGRAGKEECWLVLDAQPGAALGIGFDAPLDGAAMRAAALDGSIERLMTWHSVAPGDFFYIPAGTVHAIGAGVALIEIQQNSDITWRLFDYGRERELHLDAGVAVARGQPYPPHLHRRLAPQEEAQLADGPYFRLDRFAGLPGGSLRARYGDGPLLVIPLEGAVELGGERIRPGQCAVARDLGDAVFSQDGLFLITQPCAG